MIDLEPLRYRTTVESPRYNMGAPISFGAQNTVPPRVYVPHP